MADDFDRILDECIERINRGDSLVDCLSAYPAYAEKLRPLLQSMRGVKEAYAFVPSANARRAARQKFITTLDERQQKTTLLMFFKVFSKPAVWVTAAIVALAIIGLWSIRPSLNPPELVSNPQGNFAFLISDEPNYINDFESLNVTISRVGLQATGNATQWHEFKPEINSVDLTQLQGERSREIWRGDVPVGQYSQVIIYVSRVEGKLKATGQTIEVKLPGNKLHISKPFEVAADIVTSFTFDITVVATGNNGKYVLKPQVSESGPQLEPKPPEQKPDGTKNKSKK